MINKIIFTSYLLILCFSCNGNSKSNPCDVMCDNCMGIEQCEQCYEDCYNSLDVR